MSKLIGLNEVIGVRKDNEREMLQMGESKFREWCVLHDFMSDDISDLHFVDSVYKDAVSLAYADFVHLRLASLAQRCFLQSCHNPGFHTKRSEWRSTRRRISSYPF